MTSQKIEYSLLDSESRKIVDGAFRVISLLSTSVEVGLSTMPSMTDLAILACRARERALRQSVQRNLINLSAAGSC